MTTPYRAPPEPAASGTRPTLTIGQRFVVFRLDPAELAAQPWYRAWVGGRWSYTGTLPGLTNRHGWCCHNTPCTPPPRSTASLSGCDRDNCRCEVYPYPVHSPDGRWPGWATL